MAREFFTSVDLKGNRLLNAVLTLENTPAASAPFPLTGRIIHDNGTVKYHDGASWISLATGGGGGGGGGGDVPATLTLSAGAGLTGGGDLSANRTFDVGAGTGILVAADSVAVNTAVIQARSERGAANGYAPLDANALIPTVHLPPLAVNDVFTPASQGAMLALNAQVGDMAIRTDTGKTYVLAAEPANVLANWKEVMATGQVVSVNGQTGVVSITAASLGAASSGAQVIAGAGLTGGGLLTGDVTLNVVGDTTLNISPDQISVVSAPRWTTSRTLALTGDVTGQVSWDGSANASLAAVITPGAGGMTEAQIDALFLKPSEILAGPNISVSTANGSVTITGTGATAGHTHPSTTDFQFNYDTFATMADPGSGKVRTDTAAGVPSSQIAFSDITNLGIDASQTFASLAVGDMIYFQQLNNANNWGRYQISGVPVDNGTWWQIPVTGIEMHGAGIAKNQTVLCRFTYGTGGGGGSTLVGGLPVDGTTGQVLAKASDTDYDAEWINLSTAAGTTLYVQTEAPDAGSIPLDDVVFWVDTDDDTGTGGGQVDVVSLTQAQYDALAVKDPDTLYTITDGADRTLLTGARAPAAGDGIDGDFWINTAAWTISGPKAGGAWPAAVSMIGPKGDPGTPASTAYVDLEVTVASTDPIGVPARDGILWVKV